MRFSSLIYASSLLITTILLGMTRGVAAERCSRVVTLAPSVTELVLALGLSDNLVGVSRYDEMLLDNNLWLRKSLPKIGDLFEVNLESLLSLKPSVVMLLEEQRRFQERIEDIGLDAVVMRQKTLADIHHSLNNLGEYCGLMPQAKKVEEGLLWEMKKVTSEFHATSGSLPSETRVLIIIGFDTSSSEMRNIFVSGSDGFYFEILKQLGVMPAFHGSTGHLSTISLEGLMVLRPTHIIHIVPPSQKLPSKEELASFWQPFSQLPAVQSGMIFVKNESYFSLPGIQYPKVAEAFADLLKGS